MPIPGLNYTRALAREPCGAYMDISCTKSTHIYRYIKIDVSADMVIYICVCVLTRPKAPQYTIDVEKSNGFTTVGGRNFAPL